MHTHARPQWAVSLVRGKSVGKKEDSQLLGEHVTGEPGENPIHSHDERKGVRVSGFPSITSKVK